MSEIQTDDPAVAVLAERLSNVINELREGRRVSEERFERFLSDYKKDQEAFKKDMESFKTEVKADVKKVSAFAESVKLKLTFAKGGWAVIVAGFGTAMWLFGVFDKIHKLFQ